jgi:hypothetical protein
MSEYEENTLNYYEEFIICIVCLTFTVALFRVPHICFQTLCMETPLCFMHEYSRIISSKILETEEKM